MSPEVTDPEYYQRTDLQPREVVWRWFGLSGVMAHVLHYCYRAAIGHKPGSSAVDDLSKAATWLQYAIQMLHREGTCDE